MKTRSALNRKLVQLAAKFERKITSKFPYIFQVIHSGKFCLQISTDGFDNIQNLKP